MCENLKWKPKGRFLIEDDDKDVQRAITTQDGAKSAVCEWLLGYLRDPQKFDNDPRSNLFVRKKDNRLLVNVQGVVKCWDLYVGNPKWAPPTGVVARALAGLSDDEEGDSRLRYQDAKGRWTKYRVIEIESLVSWAEKTGVWERDEIQASLVGDTEQQLLSRLN